METILNYSLKVEFINNSFIEDISENVTNIELIQQVGNLYDIAEITLFNYHIPYNFAKDKQFHIKLTLQSQIWDFLIDDIERLGKKELKLVCKTKEALLEDIYSGKLRYLEHLTYAQAIDGILTEFGLIYNTSSLLDVSLLDSVNINVSRAEFIRDFAILIGYEIYRVDNILMFNPKRAINESDISKVDFIDFISISTETSDTNKISKVYFNTAPEDIISSEPSITLIADPSPQPLSPSTVLTFTDENNIYKVSPIQSRLTFFYNPSIGMPSVVGIPVIYRENYIAIEKFQLEADDILETVGGIKSIIALEYSENADSEDMQKAKLEIDRGVGEKLVFVSDRVDTDLNLGNFIEVELIDSRIDKAITSTIAGDGTALNPYVYSLSLGNKVNNAFLYSYAIIEPTWTIAYGNTITTKTKIEFKTNFFDNFNLSIISNSNNINDRKATIINNTLQLEIAIATYLQGNYDPADSIKIAITDALSTILKNDEFIVTNIGEEFKYGTAIFSPSSGVVISNSTSQYFAQNDNRAIAEFVNQDPNANGILKCLSAYSLTTPTTISHPLSSLDGGFGGNPLRLQEFLDYEFLESYNKIILKQKYTGYFKLSYKTNVLTSIIPPQNREHIKDIKATFLNQTLKYRHEIKATEYYPLFYKFTLNLITDWNIDTQEVINKTINILRNGAVVGSGESDEFGEIVITLEDYGVYELSTSGYDNLFISYFANEFKIDLNEPSFNNYSSTSEGGSGEVRVMNG